MLGTLLLAVTALTMQAPDSVKTDTIGYTRTLPDSAPSLRATIDTVGWVYTKADSAPIIETRLYFTSLPPAPIPSGPPSQPVIVSGPTCVDGPSASYACTLQFLPDIGVDSTYFTGLGGIDFNMYLGDSQQEATVVFPCTTTSSLMQSRSYRDGGQRSTPLLEVPVAHTCGTTPPPPPPTGANLFLDFNDAANLGVNCAGSPCSWPYRKHTYNATAGRGGTGAIVMHWFTGMTIGYSPVWVTVPFPASRHMRIDYWVRQTASMTGTSSNQKVLRFRTNGSGLLYSMFNGPAGADRLGWYWEGYDAHRSPTGFGSYTPDNQWHKHSIEIDFKNVNNMVATFWLDDVLRGSSTTASPGGEQMPGNPTQYIISPFVEQYSCGTSPPCEQYINTGDYVVDDFTFTALP